MANGVNMQEFVAGFIIEADEHLHSVNGNLVQVAAALKAGRPEPRAIREMFRSLHTIKGLASMVGADPVADIAHEMEGILRSADRAGGRIADHALDLLLAGTRAIEERVKSIAKVGVTNLAKAPAKLIEDLAMLQSTDQHLVDNTKRAKFELPEEVNKALGASDREQLSQAAISGKNIVLVDFEPSAERAANGINISTIRQKILSLGELVKVVPHSAGGSATGIAFYLLTITAESAETIAAKAELELSSIQTIHRITEAQPVSDAIGIESEVDFNFSSSDSESKSIRVDIRRLDESLERLSELIVTRSKLSKISAKLSDSGADTRELNVVLAENARQLKRLRAAITEARMVPLSELLQRLPLVVRGLTKDSGKSVNVSIQAGSAEVDKAVADKIFPAIVHIIRNSVDHGIETSDERRKLGKSEEGSISVHCDNSAGTILTLTISDDGRGINREVVARKAGQPIARSNDELLSQICSPGLSTREGVSLTSGRGMGMDIVKKTIEALGGAISLTTAEGKGTTFALRVPVSITIVDVFSFVSGGQVYVAPVAMIDEILEVDPAQLAKTPALKGSGAEPRLLNRRGETIPYLVLDAVLKKTADAPVPTKALVVNQHKSAVAFGVDRMIGQQEVVIRPIDENLLHVDGMNGAADLGDGHPTLVLDLASIGATYAKAAEVTA